MSRFVRQIQWFGPEGQDRINSTSVAIVGLGGLGAQLVIQLALAGVRTMFLIDHDGLEDLNRNRLPTAEDGDPNATPKVALAQRFVRRLDSSIQVTAIAEPVEATAAQAALARCDTIFGCVDMDSVRLELLTATSALGIDYVDLASDIEPEEGIDARFGGRICYATATRPGCPMCLGLLSQEEIQRELATDDQRQDVAKIYGVRRSQLQGSGPSVGALNALVASRAAMEFMQVVACSRTPTLFMEYRGKLGVLAVSSDKPYDGCYFCEGRCAAGERLAQPAK